MEVVPDFAGLLPWAQTLPFFVAFAALYVILWKPLVDYLEDRESAHVGTRDEANRLVSEAEERADQLQEQLSAARAEVAAARADARARAKVAESKIVDAARAESDTKVSAAIEEIGAARKAASQSIDVMAQSLSNEIAAQVLGRAVN